MSKKALLLFTPSWVRLYKIYYFAQMKKVFLIGLVLSFSCMQAQQIKRVLFLGNSYTAYNNLPALVAGIARSHGDTLIYDSHTPGGYTLEGHSNNATSIAKINQGNWDYVVLQEQSQKPSFDSAYVYNNVWAFGKKLDSIINTSDSCTQTMFYMTWGRKNGDQSNCVFFPWVCTYSGMQGQLRYSYVNMSTQNSAVVSPVGIAWRDTRQHNPGIELYTPDESHPSLAGSYLAACTFYASIFHASPIGSTYPGGLTKDVADTLQLRAHRAVFDSLPVWNIDTGRLFTNFSYAITSNDSVLFDGTVRGADTAWWDFGDGSVAAFKDTSKWYAGSGDFTVKLIARKGCMYDTSLAIVSYYPHFALPQYLLAEPRVYACGAFLCVDGAWLNQAILEVWHVNGQKMFAQTLSASENKIPLTVYARGMYLVSIRKNGYRFTQKIMLEG